MDSFRYYPRLLKVVHTFGGLHVLFRRITFIYSLAHVHNRHFSHTGSHSMCANGICTALAHVAHIQSETFQNMLVLRDASINRCAAQTVVVTSERHQAEKQGNPQLHEVVHVRKAEDLFQIETYIHENAIRKVFIDTETTGLDPYTSELVLIQILAGGKAFLVNVAAIGTRPKLDFCYDGIQQVLDNKQILKVGHNLKFDFKFLKGLFAGYDLRPRNIFDTYLAEALLMAGLKAELSLKALAKKYAVIDLDKSEQTSFRGADLSGPQIDYALKDVLVLEPILKQQSELLTRAGLVHVAMLEFSIVAAVSEIELCGMMIDPSKLALIEKRCSDRLMELEELLRQLTAEVRLPGQTKIKGSTINFRSPVQVKAVLSQLGFKVESTETKELSKLPHPFAQALVEHRKVSKLMSSFVRKLPKHLHPTTGRIHPDFMQLGTQTGRFTCENPNLQQIPRDQEWRDLFVAPEGFRIITADYSQIELRILAEYSQDPAFIEAYRTGQDLHRRTASDVFGVPVDMVTTEQRTMTKSVNFGLCYGMGAGSLARDLNITLDEAERFINTYFRAYPKVKDCLQRLGMRALKDLCSTSLLGRKRHYRPPDSFSAQKSLERKGRNTPIQATCGDIVKKAVGYLHEDLQGTRARIIHLVHDEIVLEVPEGDNDAVSGIVERDMVRAGADLLKSVPVVVDIHVDSMWRK